MVGSAGQVSGGDCGGWLAGRDGAVSPSMAVADQEARVARVVASGVGVGAGAVVGAGRAGGCVMVSSSQAGRGGNCPNRSEQSNRDIWPAGDSHIALPRHTSVSCQPEQTTQQRAGAVALNMLKTLALKAEQRLGH